MRVCGTFDPTEAIYVFLRYLHRIGRSGRFGRFLLEQQLGIRSPRPRSDESATGLDLLRVFDLWLHRLLFQGSAYEAFFIIKS